MVQLPNEVIVMAIEASNNVAAKNEYNGYWYNLADTTKVLFLGLFCGQQTLTDILAWANSPQAKEVLLTHFKIRKLPSYSHFTNLVALIDADELNKTFMEIFGKLVSSTRLKTIAIDGKTVCSTVNANPESNPSHIKTNGEICDKLEVWTNTPN